MSSTEEQVKELRRQIEGLEQVGALEARLIELKKSDADPEELNKVKHDLREARRQYRQGREAQEPEEGTVQPDTVQASAQVEEDK